jgi:hypothetical protein
MMDKVPDKKTVSVNFRHAPGSLLDFLTLENGTNRLYRNVGNELSLYGVQHHKRAQISHDDLVI